jgi:hypothetical protein
MQEIPATRARRDDLETSMSKLVSAFLAVAEDLASEEAYQAKEDRHQRVAAGPATSLVARSKTPEQGANDRDTGLGQSEPREETKRKSPGWRGSRRLGSI